MATEILSVRLDKETKENFASVCEAVGLSSSQAIKVFAKAVINHNGLPFELKSKEPNAASIAAFKELEEGGGTTVGSMEELITALESDD